MNNKKKIIDWLYSKGNDCSDFQKELRFYMWCKYLKEKLSGVDATNYKLNNKEQSLLERVIGKKI
jgi:hypothetical protein